MISWVLVVNLFELVYKLNHLTFSTMYHLSYKKKIINLIAERTLILLSHEEGNVLILALILDIPSLLWLISPAPKSGWCLLTLFECKHDGSRDFFQFCKIESSRARFSFTFASTISKPIIWGSCVTNFTNFQIGALRDYVSLWPSLCIHRTCRNRLWKLYFADPHHHPTPMITTWSLCNIFHHHNYLQLIAIANVSACCLRD